MYLRYNIRLYIYKIYSNDSNWDVSAYGKISSKNIQTTIIEAGKLVGTDTFGDLSLKAYNTNKSNAITAKLTIQGDTPKLTLSTTGSAHTTVVISGVDTPAAASDAANRSYIDTHASATVTHGATGAIVGTTNTQTLTNKDLTDSTNNVTARSLKSATTVVDVSAATAPTAGQVLTATSGTAATWQTITPTVVKAMGTDVTGSITVGATNNNKHHLVTGDNGAYTITLPNTIGTAIEFDFTLIGNNTTITFASDANCKLYYPGSTGLNNNTALMPVTERFSTVTARKVSATEWVIMGPVI